MSYTNLISSNPKKFSLDIEQRSGTSATPAAVAAEYVTLGYEPGVGTLYMSSSGLLFLHKEAGTTDDTWATIYDTEAKTQTQSVSMTLTPSLGAWAITKLHQVTATLTPTIQKAISELNTVTATLTPAQTSSFGRVINLGVTLAAEFAYDLTNKHEIFNVGVTLTPNMTVSVVNNLGVTATLTPDFSYSHNPN